MPEQPSDWWQKWGQLVAEAWADEGLKKRLVADPAKLRAATGWEPRYTIEQTLADMLQHARETLEEGPRTT